MSWLIEDPSWVWVVGGFVAAALLMAFWSSGRGVFLTWFGAVVFLVLALLLIERYVVTDRELIEETIYGAAAAVEANDIERTLSYFSPTAEPLRALVRRRMGSLEVLDAAVAGLKIELGTADTRRSTAKFLGRLEVRSSSVPRNHIPIRMTVALVKEGERWLVESYELRDDR
jgi:hypothetical protein